MHRPSTTPRIAIRGQRRQLAILALIALALAAPAPAGALTFATNSTIDVADATPGDGLCATVGGACTLRAAITEANATAGPDEVTLLAATYDLDPLLGTLEISDDLEIHGVSIAATAIETMDLTRQDPIRILDVTARLDSLAIIGTIAADNALVDNHGALTIAEASIAGTNGRGLPGIRNRNVLVVEDSTLEGQYTDISAVGALRNEGTVTVLRSLIIGSAGAQGGTLVANEGDAFVSDSIVTTTLGGTAITNVGTLEAVRSEIDGFSNDLGCFGAVRGGGIANFGTLELKDCSVTGFGHCGGGALSNAGTAAIVGSTLGGLSDQGGGAIANTGGTLVMRNSTVSASTTNGLVGGIDNTDGGTVELHGCTITDNTGGQFATVAGGVRGTHIAIGHTIIAGNHGTPPDCQGTLLSLGHNLIGDTTGCTVIGDHASNLVDVDPRLGPLAANGGPTLTHALLPGSPALDAGLPMSGGFCPAADQRGIARPQGPACDIGAFERTTCGDGTVDADEECDDGNTADGDCCSSWCRLVPDGSTCDDRNACTSGSTCRAGACTASASVGCGACETCDAARGCIARVLPTCHRPTKRISGQLEIVDGRTSKVNWKWIAGEATTRAEFGDPPTSAPFAFCVFDESGPTPRVAFQSATRTGRCGRRPCWRSDSKSTFRYRDTADTPNGIDSVFLKNGTDGKAKVVVDAHGPELALPTLPVALPLRVQLQAPSGACWEATYVQLTTSRNSARRMKAKAFEP